MRRFVDTHRRDFERHVACVAEAASRSPTLHLINISRRTTHDAMTRSKRPATVLEPHARTAPVVVIGAGPAGLTAALQLAELGVPVLVVEANTRVGGLAQTVEYKGFRFDIGGHRFFTKVPAVRDLWRSMLGADFLTRPRLSRIFFDGKFFDYPLKPADALAQPGRLPQHRDSRELPVGQGTADPSGSELRRLGHEPLRTTGCSGLFFEDLHRESVGHSVPHDQRTVGRPADPGPVAAAPPSSTCWRRG